MCSLAASPGAPLRLESDASGVVQSWLSAWRNRAFTPYNGAHEVYPRVGTTGGQPDCSHS